MLDRVPVHGIKVIKERNFCDLFFQLFNPFGNFRTAFLVFLVLFESFEFFFKLLDFFFLAAGESNTAAN